MLPMVRLPIPATALFRADQNGQLVTAGGQVQPAITIRPTR